jgi:hypothetical protein
MSAFTGSTLSLHAASTPEADDYVQKGHETAVNRRFRMRRPVVNITPPERAGRIVVGLVGVVGGLVLLSTASAPLLIGLEVLLVLAGLDLVVTGALGHCPLYRKLGYVPPSMRRPA